MLPAVAVLGIGAVASPEPPVWVVYHNRLAPGAVNGLASSPTQYCKLLTVGANGLGLTVTVAASVNEILQLPLVTSVKFKVASELTPLTVTSTVPPASMVAVLVEVPS